VNTEWGTKLKANAKIQNDFLELKKSGKGGKWNGVPVNEKNRSKNVKLH
jgi:hypothetical protein